jgi:DNA-binding response OmpR family regulator
MTPPAPSPRKRVLLVEDDAGVQHLLRDLLESEGYRVLSSAFPLDPIDVSQLRPALVVLDLWFDGLASGWDWLESMRVTPGARDIPVLICTADASVVTAQTHRLSDLGANVLLKPFDLDDLLARVAAACGPPLPTRYVATLRVEAVDVTRSSRWST